MSHSSACGEWVPWAYPSGHTLLWCTGCCLLALPALPSERQPFHPYPCTRRELKWPQVRPSNRKRALRTQTRTYESLLIYTELFPSEHLEAAVSTDNLYSFRSRTSLEASNAMQCRLSFKRSLWTFFSQAEYAKPKKPLPHVPLCSGTGQVQVGSEELRVGLPCLAAFKSMNLSLQCWRSLPNTYPHPLLSFSDQERNESSVMLWLCLFTCSSGVHLRGYLGHVPFTFILDNILHLK